MDVNTTLKDRVTGFKKVIRNHNVKRNDEAYRQCYEFTCQELERLLDIYRGTVFVEDMRARLLRDSIDHHIRRYHGYAIQGKIGSHYIEVGAKKTDCTFEHVIPESSIRDMLIEQRITINQALNSPTCYIRKDHNKILNESGLAKTSHDHWNFFKRYQVFSATFETYNGMAIKDLNTWSLENHYNFFSIV